MNEHACKTIRDEMHYEALSCISPIETPIGFKVNTLVSYRGMVYHMKYFEEHEGLLLYFDVNYGWYYLQKNHEHVWMGECPPTSYQMVKYSDNKLIVLYSVFSFMMRMVRRMRKKRHLADAVYEADLTDATIDAVSAASDAAAASAVYDAPIDTASAIAYDAALAAFNTSAALTDSAYDKAGRRARKAFKALMKYRREVMKHA